VKSFHARATKNATAAMLALSMALGGVALSRCAKNEPTKADDSTVVDSELLAFLSLARAHHHEANLLEQSGDVTGAIAALEKIVSAPKPHPGERLPEVEEVLADTYARMAELELANKNVAGARRDVETGLLHVTEPTYFRGHLLEVYGIIEEARTAELRDAGNTAEADKARQHALALLREAVDVQEAVIGRVLDASSGKEGGR
jgi:tetratricopeptide (TPR) repeat protein